MKVPDDKVLNGLAALVALLYYFVVIVAFGFLSVWLPYLLYGDATTDQHIIPFFLSALVFSSTIIGASNALFKKCGLKM